MTKSTARGAAVLAGALVLAGGGAAADDAGTVYGHQAKTIDGADASLGEHRGKVLLIVNTASRCGFTPQYEGLEELWRAYKDQGLVVLGFPCNDFGGQEPGTESEIKAFCSERFEVSFPLFGKVRVKAGDGQHPLYRDLVAGTTNAATAGAIKWNFTKFLVGRDGKVTARFESMTKPTAQAVREAVERELAKPAPAPAPAPPPAPAPGPGSAGKAGF
jgi:glutathione peroxidase